jgi:hypothetical protein
MLASAEQMGLPNSKIVVVNNRDFFLLLILWLNLYLTIHYLSIYTDSSSPLCWWRSIILKVTLCHHNPTVVIWPGYRPPTISKNERKFGKLEKKKQIHLILKKWPPEQDSLWFWIRADRKIFDSKQNRGRIWKPNKCGTIIIRIEIKVQIRPQNGAQMRYDIISEPSGWKPQLVFCVRMVRVVLRTFMYI